MFFHKAYQFLHLAFGEEMAGLAELRLEGHRFHKSLIVSLPNRIAIEIPVENEAFHIICQHVLGNSRIGKSMKRSNEKAFLLCVGEELNIALTTVVTNIARQAILYSEPSLSRTLVKFLPRHYSTSHCEDTIRTGEYFLLGPNQSRRIRPSNWYFTSQVQYERVLSANIFS